jgi:hypothetical protein
LSRKPANELGNKARQSVVQTRMCPASASALRHPQLMKMRMSLAQFGERMAIVEMHDKSTVELTVAMGKLPNEAVRSMKIKDRPS